MISGAERNSALKLLHDTRATAWVCVRFSEVLPVWAGDPSGRSLVPRILAGSLAEYEYVMDATGRALHPARKSFCTSPAEGFQLRSSRVQSLVLRSFMCPEPDTPTPLPGYISSFRTSGRKIRCQGATARADEEVVVECGFLVVRERSSGDGPGRFGDRGSALWRSKSVHDGTYKGTIY